MPVFPLFTPVPPKVVQVFRVPKDPSMAWMEKLDSPKAWKIIGSMAPPFFLVQLKTWNIKNLIC